MPDLPGIGSLILEDFSADLVIGLMAENRSVSWMDPFLHTPVSSAVCKSARFVGRSDLQLGLVNARSLLPISACIRI